MKIKIKIVILFVLLLVSTNIFAQKIVFKTCIDCISLSEQQKIDILVLEKNYQNYMDSLRIERRSIRDIKEKDIIRLNMLKKVADHQNTIMALLDSIQKEEYLKFLSNGTLHRHHFFSEKNIKQ